MIVQFIKEIFRSWNHKCISTPKSVIICLIEIRTSHFLLFSLAVLSSIYSPPFLTVYQPSSKKNISSMLIMAIEFQKYRQLNTLFLMSPYLVQRFQILSCQTVVKDPRLYGTCQCLTPRSTLVWPTDAGKVFLTARATCAFSIVVVAWAD